MLRTKSRFLIGLVTLLALSFGAIPAFAAQAYYSAFTVQAGQVTGTQSSFPMLIKPTDNRFRTVGNGGHVQNANGYDLRPYSDAALTTALTYELVPGTYNASTGTFEMWVNVASLADGGVVYLGYGDTSITTNGSSTSTWNSAYKGVWHLPTVTGGADTVLDSTVNAANGTPNNSPTNTTGIIDGAGAFVGASSQFISDGFTSQPSGNSPVTQEAWVKFTNSASVLELVSFFGTDGPAGTKGANFLYRSAAGKAVSEFGSGDGGATGTTTLAAGTFYHIAGVYDGATNKIYVNGAQEASVSFSTANFTGNRHRIADYRGTVEDKYLTGTVDEVRVSNTARSAGWLATSYNNQVAPGTFYAIGAEQGPFTSNSPKLNFHSFPP